MKAAVLHGPRNLRLETVPTPRLPSVGEVILRVEYAAVCGTDVHAYRGSIPTKTPVVLGHEYAGRVLQVGKGVRGFKAGDRVVGSYVATCGTCRYCVLGKPQLCERRILFGLNYDGAFAQYMKVPRADRTLVKVPDDMDLRTAVLIPDMFLTALYAVERGGVGPGSSVLVIGLGSVGLSIVAAARLAGARKIIGVVRRGRPRPIEFAKKMGVTHLINTGEEKDPIGRIRALTGGLGVDVAFEASGAPPAVRLALDSLRPCGVHVQVGIVGEPSPLDLRYLTSLEKTIIGVLNPGSTIHIERAIDVVRAHGLDLEGLVTHEFPLSDIGEALEAVERKVGDPVKVVVKTT